MIVNLKIRKWPVDSVLVRITTAVTNHYDQKQRREEMVCLAYVSSEELKLGGNLEAGRV